MELTDKHLETIRETARGIDFGSVTINISANSNKLDLSIQKRVRYDDEPECSVTSNKAKNGVKLKKKA